MRLLDAARRYRLREIRPAPPPRRVNYGRVYRMGLAGVAILTGLALLHGSQRLAIGFLVALALGVVWVGWLAHRRVVATTIALGWWLVTAPAVGLLGTADAPPAEAYAVTASATASVALLGLLVAVAALFTRARRVWLVLVLAWLVNVLAVLAAAFLLPSYALLAGAGVTMLALAVVGSGATLGRPDRAPRPAALAGLPAAYRVRGLGEEWVVVGRTGTYLVALVDLSGTVATAGRRLTVGGADLDEPLDALVRAAETLGAEIRTPIRPVAALTHADFPDDPPGVYVVDARGSGEVLVLAPDLLVPRLRHGHTALSVGQVRRIAARLRRAAAA